MDKADREKGIYKVTIVGSVVNFLLLIFKFVAGIAGHSAAMIADAVHSLSDFVTDIIEKRGLKPIIAHIDRYSSRGRAKLLNIPGALFQVNAESLLKIGKAKRECLELLKNGSAHFIGSDVHGKGEGTYKRFSRAIKKIGDPISQITNNSRKILAGR